MYYFQKTVAILLLVMPVTHIAAQTGMDSTWSYQGNLWDPWFSDGFQTLIFGDNATIRSGPSKEATKITTLPIAMAVTVLAHDTARLAQDGRVMCWHQISWQDTQQQPQTGWVWGGLLASAGAISGENTFVLGCMKGKTGPQSLAYRYEARVLRAGAQVAVYTFPEVQLGESQIFTFSVEGPRGLDDFDNVVLFNWANAMCGGGAKSYYLLWNGQQFKALPPISTSGEMGIGKEERYIFPDERKNVEYSLPLLYFYEKTENQSAILYYKSVSSGDENGGDVHIHIQKVIPGLK